MFGTCDLDSPDGVGNAGFFPTFGGKNTGPPVGDRNEGTPERGGGSPPGPPRPNADGLGRLGERVGIAGKADLRVGSCGGGMAIPDNDAREGSFAERVPRLAPDGLFNLPTDGPVFLFLCGPNPGSTFGLGGVGGLGVTNGAALGLNSF